MLFRAKSKPQRRRSPRVVQPFYTKHAPAQADHAAGADLLAECVRGEEAISRGYTFKIDALSVDAHIPLKSLLGQPALLQLLTASSQ